MTEIGVIKLGFKHRYIPSPHPCSPAFFARHICSESLIAVQKSRLKQPTSRAIQRNPHVIKADGKIVALDVRFCLAFPLNHLHFFKAGNMSARCSQQEQAAFIALCIFSPPENLDHCRANALPPRYSLLF